MITDFSTPLIRICSNVLGAFFLTTGLLSVSVPLQALAENKYTYVLGVFPHLPPRDLEKVYAPIAADLDKAIDGGIEFRTSTTYDKFSANLDAEVYDIALVQPFDYVRIADRHGYLLLATRTEKLSAIVVTKKDSPLNSLSDLRNKKIALPPKVAAVSRLLRNHLRDHGLNPGENIEIKYQRSHVSCMRKVLIGDAVACGTAAPARRYFQEKFGVELKVIARSREIPHTPWIIHPRVSKKDRKLIRNRILNWGVTRKSQEFLSRGKLTPFVPTKDSDYNIVRKMAR